MSWSARLLGGGVMVIRVIMVIAMAIAATSLPEAAPRVLAAQPEPAPDPSRAFLDANCVACHNSRRLTASLSLDGDTVDPRAAHENAEVSERGNPTTTAPGKCASARSITCVLFISR